MSQLSFDDVRGRHHAEDLPTGFDDHAMAAWRTYFENVARTRYGGGYTSWAKGRIRSVVFVPEPVPPRRICGVWCERLDGEPSCGSCGAFSTDRPESEPDPWPFAEDGYLDVDRLTADGWTFLGALSDADGMIV